MDVAREGEETVMERKREGRGHGGMSGHMPVVKKLREMGTYRGMLEG